MRQLHQARVADDDVCTDWRCSQNNQKSTTQIHLVDVSSRMLQLHCRIAATVMQIPKLIKSQMFDDRPNMKSIIAIIIAPVDKM